MGTDVVTIDVSKIDWKLFNTQMVQFDNEISLEEGNLIGDRDSDAELLKTIQGLTYIYDTVNELKNCVGKKEATLTGMNWQYLREAKLELIKTMDNEQGNLTGDASNDLEVQGALDAMQGILNLVDHIQDEAAKVLGDDIVFAPEYEISLPDTLRDDGTYSSFASNLSKEEALSLARERYGADEEGRVSIVNRIS